jgi:hypothetical protein
MWAAGAAPSLPGKGVLKKVYAAWRGMAPTAMIWLTYSPDFAQWKCGVFPGSTMTDPSGKMALKTIESSVSAF